MTIAELTQTKGWKNFMAKLYGIGASVVIIGALFKIMHWPGAGLMLMAGLGTEAIIFFFSAFEPLHEEVDWSLVYPQLAGLEPEATPVPTGGTGGGTQVSIFDEKLLESAEDAPELVQKLTKGLENLTNTTTNLSDISDAALATNQYTESMNKASENVNQLSDSYKQSVENVNQSAESLSDSYKKSAENLTYTVEGLTDSYSQVSQKVSEAGGELANSYKKLTESMDLEVDFSTVIQGNESYNEKLGVLNKNLSALNAVFELQLEGGLEQMMEDLKGSVKASQKYKDEVGKLAGRVEELNTIYGNMLSAMKQA